MKNELNEVGPMYGVTLIDTLPLSDNPNGMLQQMPDSHDLKSCMKRYPRVVAGYEVLLAHYKQAMQKLEACGSANTEAQ